MVVRIIRKLYVRMLGCSLTDTYRRMQLAAIPLLDPAHVALEKASCYYDQIPKPLSNRDNHLGRFAKAFQSETRPCPFAPSSAPS